MMVNSSDVRLYALTAAVESSCKVQMIANSSCGKLYEYWSMVHSVDWLIELYAFLRFMKQISSGRRKSLAFSMRIPTENS